MMGHHRSREVEPQSVVPHMHEHWATFDCYGTLIDWNRGIRDVLGRVFGAAAADAALRRFHDVEPYRANPERGWAKPFQVVSSTDTGSEP